MYGDWITIIYQKWLDKKSGESDKRGKTKTENEDPGRGGSEETQHFQVEKRNNEQEELSIYFCYSEFAYYIMWIVI